MLSFKNIIKNQPASLLDIFLSFQYTYDHFHNIPYNFGKHTPYTGLCLPKLFKEYLGWYCKYLYIFFNNLKKQNGRYAIYSNLPEEIIE